MKRAITVALSTIATAAGMTTVALPAQAAPAGCPGGSFCVYLNTGYTGGHYYASGNDTNWNNDNFSGTTISVGNDDSAWFNNGFHDGTTPDYVKVYDYREMQGRMTICLRYGTGFPSKAASNDDGESHTWAYGC